MKAQPRPEDTIAEEALRLRPEQRRAYLDGACGNNAGLRGLVEALLHAHKQLAVPRDQQPTEREVEPFLPSLPITEKPGDRIGRYKLLQQIGVGGCGVVYMAEQEEPVKRRVALKVIKLGMDTKQVIARFEAERQALALMDHPNIAKVLDGGATDTGRPFFVMELVKGIPITPYCDENKLDTRQRLELFIQVCQAIQHAHQKGIIHRDIKPSNVLVADHDGVPVPKVIDFGIAKATAGQTLTDKTLFTAFEQFMGTPAYMSPEQAKLSGLDIDTRSDIYGLGVLLYELLTGRTPFEVKDLHADGLDELRRTIREKEPTRPSTKLSLMADADLMKIARQRQSEPAKLTGLIRGDLDWIVMRCLEKDRTRRYDTANGLALDIQRHLSNEPVVARPPSNVYRLQKLVRRNKIAFAAAALVAASLILGLVTSTWLFFGERTARQQAYAEAAKSKLVANLLADTIGGIDPSVARGRELTVVLREVLDKTGKRLSLELKDFPEAKAELLSVFAKTYGALSLYTNALEAANEALRLRKLNPGPTNPSVADTLALLGEILYEQRDLSGAEDYCRQGLQMRRNLLGSMHTNVATSLSDLGLALWREGKLDEAEACHREALSIRTNLLGSENLDVAKSLSNLANVLSFRGEGGEAEKLYRHALGLWRKLGNTNDPRFVIVLNNLGVALYKNGELAEARKTHAEALAVRHNLYGQEQSDVAASLNNLADVLADLGELAEGEQVCRDGLEIRHKLLGDENYDVAESLHTLGVILGRQGKLDLAEKTLRDALRMRKQYLPAEQVYVADTLQQLSLVLAVRGALREARTNLVELVAMRKKLEGPEHPDVGAALWTLAWVQERMGDPLLKGPTRAEALALGLHHGPLGVYALAGTLHGLSDLLQVTGKLAEAEPILLEAFEYLQKNPESKPALQRDAVRRLIRLYDAWDKTTPNTGKDTQAVRWREKLEALPPEAQNGALEFPGNSSGAQIKHVS